MFSVFSTKLSIVKKKASQQVNVACALICHQAHVALHQKVVPIVVESKLFISICNNTWWNKENDPGFQAKVIALFA